MVSEEEDKESSSAYLARSVNIPTDADPNRTFAPGQNRRDPPNLITNTQNPNARRTSPVRFVLQQMNYKSKRWKKLRERILRRDGYLCQESLRYGRHIEATTVHHILPAETFPEYQWEPWNLISLSAEMHNKMHDRDSKALTELGLKYFEKVSREKI